MTNSVYPRGCARVPTPRPTPRPPAAQDLGYNEMNFMNSTRGIQTPNLDALASKGIVSVQRRRVGVLYPFRTGPQCAKTTG